MEKLRLRQIVEQTRQATYSRIINCKVLSYTFQIMPEWTHLSHGPFQATLFEGETDQRMTCVLTLIHQHIKEHTWKADAYSFEILP